MNVIILGAAGFIGTNLAIKIKNYNTLKLVDKKIEYFQSEIKNQNFILEESNTDNDTDYVSLLKGQDVVYHLISSTFPSNSNQNISQELSLNVVNMANILDACIINGVKKIIFISSGGTVYGKDVQCPISEDTPTNPITSYGIQKVTIEKLLYLYNYMYGLDYRVIRLANPYGPYQRPNGVLGVVTTFTYKAIKNEVIQVYGDGSVIRDFIYIDDAINAILKISNGFCNFKTYNIGCGYGTSIKSLINAIENALKTKLKVYYQVARQVDVPVNYLDISRYESEFGNLNPISLKEGIQRTADFMRHAYGIY